MKPFKKFLRSLSITTIVAVMCASIALVPTLGCTPAQESQIVGMIAADLPSLIATAAQIATLAGAFAGQQGGSASTWAKIQADAQAISVLVADYQSKAGSSTDIFANIEIAVDVLTQDADTAVATLANVSNPANVTKLGLLMQSIDTGAHLLDSYINSVLTPQQLQAKAAKRTVRYQRLVSTWNVQRMDQVARTHGTTFAAIYERDLQAGF